MFDIELIADEESEDFIDESPIFDDEEVGIKNAGVFGSDGFCDALLHLENLDSGGDESGLEAIDFVRDLVFFDAPRGRDFVIGSANKNRAPGDSWRDGDPLESTFFGGGNDGTHVGGKDGTWRGLVFIEFAKHDGFDFEEGEFGIGAFAGDEEF